MFGIEQGTQLKSHGGPKKFLTVHRGQNDMFSLIKRVQLSRKKLKAQNIRLGGPI